ncbi:MAG: DUF3046 domain-containing protein [Mycobacteriales bacterium]
MRLSEFWASMERQFGPAYAASVARDHVLAGLGGHTVDEAIAAGYDTRAVWRVVCDYFEVPEDPVG